MTRSRLALSILPLVLWLAPCTLALAAPSPLGAGAVRFGVDDRALALAAPGDPGTSVSGAPATDPLAAASLRHSNAGGSGHETRPLVAMGKSLLIPGWGQLATGHRMQAAVFAGLEFSTWVAYGTFQRQGALRRDSYFATALLFAGIDLHGKSENYRRFVGQYQSSDVYNQYVVRREAAYFFTDSTEQAQFLASHLVGPANAWSWGSDYDAFLTYRAQRRSSEQAFQRARYALGFAVVNRLVSALAAAREAGSLRKAARTSDLDGAPGHPAASLAVDLAPGPGLVPDARLACVVRF